MINRNKPKEVRIVTMTKITELPDNYLERIEILQQLLRDSTRKGDKNVGISSFLSRISSTNIPRSVGTDARETHITKCA